MSENKIDLSFIKGSRNVVLCQTRDDAEILIDTVVRKYPDYERSLYMKLSRYEEECDDEGLAFRLNEISPGRLDHGYCTASWYRREGYNIIILKDLIVIPDFGTFEHGFTNTADALSALF